MNNQDNHSSCSCCAPTPEASPVQANENNMSSKLTAGICPSCTNKGKKVDSATVKALLSVSLRQLRDIPYYFCREAECDVVYFSEDGEQSFDKHQVRERVFQKETGSGDVHVCYCFDHTPDSIRLEIGETGQSTVVDEINAGIKAGQCACDWRNPQGSCCLGNVKQLVKELEQQMESTAG